jgi:isoleucyl-tRNA synthetase
VHLTAYPQVNESLIDEALEQSIAAVIRIKNLALGLRTQSKVKIRQPLNTLYVRPKDAADRRVLENADYVAQILEETNLKHLTLIDDEKALVKVRLKPDNKKIGPRAGRYLKAIGEALEGADPAQVLKGGPFSIALPDQAFELAPEEIIVSFEGAENLK